MNMFITIVVVIVVVAYYKFLHRSPRDRQIDMAVKHIFDIKKGHHDKIVKALKNGASESDHIDLLEEKRIAVLEAITESEQNLNIVIDKKEPTTPGPIVVLER